MRPLERARRVWQSLRVDPAKTSLGRWLSAAHITIVLLLLLGVSLAAIRMLHTLADDEGKARVQLAGAMAREDLRRLVEDTVTAARGLAERPALQRLFAENRTEEIAPLLRRFCEMQGIDSCALLADMTPMATSGTELPWSELAAAAGEQGDGFLYALPGGAPSLAGAAVKLTTAPDGRNAKVYIARLIDDRLSGTLSKHVGLDVRVINYRTFTNAPVDDFTALHSAALTDGRSAVFRIVSRDLYAASFPVYASSGEAIALIEARLPARELDTVTSQLIQRLLITAVVLGLLAIAAGVLISRVVAGPVKLLTDAAVRLGQGDFSTSIPSRGAAEVGALARTMEHMRRNLVDLTGTLRRREAEARAVLGGIVEGVYAVDKDRVIRYLNPQASRLLGLEPGQGPGRFCGDVLNPERDADGRRPCEDRCPILLARRDGTTQAIESLQRSDGSTRTTIITSSDLAEGLQVQVIRDETELEAVRRARDSVLANISHEFRTPLAAQLASIELLRDGLDSMGADTQRELVFSLERGTLRLTRLIDNLLESVRIEAGQLGIRRQEVELAEVIDDARMMVESLLVLRHQQLEVELPEHLPAVTGDATRLTQVFVNLIANANKFAPEHSSIRIGAAHSVPPDQTVTVWIEDDGKGVTDADSAAIFDRFRRSTGNEPEPAGLGLGLWIVKSIIERHGGTIDWARTPDAKTRFTITLQAADRQSDA